MQNKGLGYAIRHKGELINVDDYTIDRAALQHVPEFRESPLQGIEIPRDPQLFYDDFGWLDHPFKKDPETGFAIKAKQLTWYQLKAWGSRDLIMVSTNKSGKTTSFSLEDFQSRLLPEHAGRDLLLVAQNQKMANMHLLDLKKLVRSSEKYSKFMIERPDLELFKEEKSKLETMYIRNPYNNNKPSRILALGGSEASAYSWKNVDWIHGSDLSQLKSKDSRMFFGALFSRLANTNGVFKLETIPGAREGEVWRLWRLANGMGEEVDDADLAEDASDVQYQFDAMKITWRDAVKAGVISIDYIKRMKQRLDEYTFRQLFEAEFVEVENQWYKEEWFRTGDYGATF